MITLITIRSPDGSWSRTELDNDQELKQYLRRLLRYVETLPESREFHPKHWNNYIRLHLSSPQGEVQF